MSRPTIGYYNRFFDRWSEVEPEVVPIAPARFLPGGEPTDRADAVVFHLPTLQSLDRIEKPSGQLWVAYSLESSVTCPLLADPAAMARFDLTMTYQRSSDVWCPYFGPGTVPWLLRPPKAHDASAPVVHLQSNPYDASGRNRYAFDLMRKIKVDSLGTVLRNRDQPVGPGWPGRVATMERYQFTLAFENSIATDYVSDKFFDPLAVGSVPVYRGAPEVRELAPAPDSYVDAADFDGPEALAAHLRELDADPEAYARYHAWRERGFSPSFQEHLERLREPPSLRLARAVAARLGATP